MFIENLSKIKKSVFDNQNIINEKENDLKQRYKNKIEQYKIIDLKKNELREYQKEIILKTCVDLKFNKNILIHLPTGGGKTVIADVLSRILNDENKRILIITPRKSILEQFVSTMKDAYILHSDYKNDSKILEHSKKILSMPITAANRNINNIDILITDEVHIGQDAESLKKIKENNPKLLTIGLSATPFNFDKSYIKGFQTIINDYDLKYLIEKGFLSSLKIEELIIPDLRNVAINKIDNDYDKQSLVNNLIEQKENKISHLLSVINNTIFEIKKHKKVIVFAVNIQHAIQLENGYRKFGLNVKAIHSEEESSKNKEIINKFRKSKEQEILVSVDMITTGFDVPEVSLGIIVRPTKSYNLYIQMIGRVLRKFPGKKEGKILDCAGIVQEHGSIIPDMNIIQEGNLKKYICNTKTLNSKETNDLIFDCEYCLHPNLLKIDNFNINNNQCKIEFTCSQCKKNNIIKELSIDLLFQNKLELLNKYYQYEIAKTMVHKLNILDVKNKEEWDIYLISHRKLIDIKIPTNPETIYSKENMGGWENWESFIGISNIKQKENEMKELIIELLEIHKKLNVQEIYQELKDDLGLHSEKDELFKIRHILENNSNLFFEDNYKWSLVKKNQLEELFINNTIEKENSKEEIIIDDNINFSNLKNDLEDKNNIIIEKEDINQRVTTTKIIKSGKEDTKNKLYEMYNGHCQICNFTFKKEKDSKNFFELFDFFRNEKHSKIKLGSSLCLCSNCANKMKYSENILNFPKTNSFEDYIFKKKFFENGIFKVKDLYIIEVVFNKKEIFNIFYEENHFKDFIKLLHIEKSEEDKKEDIIIDFTEKLEQRIRIFSNENNLNDIINDQVIDNINSIFLNKEKVELSTLKNILNLEKIGFNNFPIFVKEQFENKIKDFMKIVFDAEDELNLKIKNLSINDNKIIKQKNYTDELMGISKNEQFIFNNKTFTFSSGNSFLINVLRELKNLDDTLFQKCINDFSLNTNPIGAKHIKLGKYKINVNTSTLKKQEQMIKIIARYRNEYPNIDLEIKSI